MDNKGDLEEYVLCDRCESTVESDLIDDEGLCPDCQEDDDRDDWEPAQDKRIRHG